MEYKMIKKKQHENYIFINISLTGYSGDWLDGLGKNVNLSDLGLTTILSFQGQYVMCMICYSKI